MASFTAGILSTGTEILQGLYADTNAAWLSAQLTAAGIQVICHVAAPDTEGAVSDGLRYLAGKCQLVIMTGGLGPTEDDLTRPAVCDVFGVDLLEDARAWAMIEERFARRGVPPSAGNRVQCLIPRGARVLYNDWGTAPGFVLESVRPGLPWFAALPGPPREMVPMYEKYLAPEMGKKFGANSRTRIRTLHTFGHPESQLNDILRDLFAELREDPYRNLAFLASEAKVDIRLTVHGPSQGAISQILRSLENRILRQLPQGAVYGKDDDTLEAVVSDLLREKGLKAAVAESCTGGLISKRLTDLPGSSDILLEGWVTYTDEAKQKRLGVRKSTIERYGAVSSQVVEEMAAGARKKSGSDIAVAVSGIAGPGGGTADKPVGTVWYGLAWKDASADVGGVASRQTSFSSGRDLVRAFASHRALDLIRRHLLGLPLDFSNPGEARK